MLIALCGKTKMITLFKHHHIISTPSLRLHHHFFNYDYFCVFILNVNTSSTIGSLFDQQTQYQYVPANLLQ